MKILIQNYASPISTEPIYFNQTFSMQEEIESTLWSPNQMGVFDTFDRVQPDVFVCHHLGISSEILAYISNNKNIRVCINISNIKKEHLEMLETVIKNNNINCVLMFSNNYDFIAQEKPSSIKYEKILPGADIYLLNQNNSEYSIEAAVVSTDYNEEVKKLENKYETYHKMKIGQEQDENFDMNVNVMILSKLYDKYKEVLLCDNIDIVFSQIFYDAFLKSNKVTLKIPQDQKSLMATALSEIFKEENDDDLIEKVKQQIKENHTCINRSRQLIEAIF